MTAYTRLAEAVALVKPVAAVVLGSGLSGATVGFESVATCGYGEVPGLVPPTVAGHRGELAVGTWSGLPVLVFAGRLHFYEGHSWPQATRLVHLAADLGVRTLLLTNAAGGIHPTLSPGSLMVIGRHIQLLDGQAWTALAATSFAPLKEVLTPYSPRLVAELLRVEPGLLVGTYAALTGPCYETPAEIRALRAMGADAVGMSTAREAEAARERGLEVVALSSITNWAAGLSEGILTHHEVETTARQIAGRVGRLIGQLLAQLEALGLR